MKPSASRRTQNLNYWVFNLFLTKNHLFVAIFIKIVTWWVQNYILFYIVILCINNLFSVSQFAYFPSLTDIIMTIKLSNKYKWSIIEKLNKIPKKLNLQIKISSIAEWIWYDSDFWNFVFNYPSIKVYAIFMESILKKYGKSEAIDVLRRKCIFSFKESMHISEQSKLLKKIMTKIILID